MALAIALEDGMHLLEFILMPSTRTGGFDAWTMLSARIPPMGGPALKQILALEIALADSELRGR